MGPKAGNRNVQEQQLQSGLNFRKRQAVNPARKVFYELLVFLDGTALLRALAEGLRGQSY